MATRVGKRRASVQSPVERTLRRSRSLGFARGDWWTWSFLPLCLLYVVLVATHFSHILVNVYGSSDASSPLVIAEFFGDRAGGHVIASNFPWYSILIFEEATKWLPAHRQIWELGPFCFGLMSIALMSWAASRVAGRWAAALTAVILLCAGPIVLELMLWLTNHTPTWYSLALLAAFLVLLTERNASIGWLPLTILTLFVGVIVGINAATDKELIISGLLPLLFASVVTWALSRTAVAAKAMWFALAVTAVIGVSAISTVSIMHAAGVRSNGYQLGFAGIEAVSTNVKAWWQSITLLANGSFFGETIKFRTAIAFISAASILVVVLLIPRYVWRYLSSRQSGDEPLDERLSVYMIFWAASIVCLSAGFIFSSAPIHPVTAEGAGYLVGLVYAVAAMLPLLARRSAAIRAVVVAGTLVFLLNSVIALDRSNSTKAPPQASGPSPQVARDVARVAEETHATFGYSLYWDAAAITWRANFRVLVAPVVGCGPTGPKLCPGPNGYLEAWYYHIPRRTFLLTDTSVIDWNPSATLGQTIATHRFGTVTMYVYNYNIIEKLFPD